MFQSLTMHLTLRVGLDLTMDVHIIWAWSCDFETANQSPIVGSRIRFADNRQGVVRLIGARSNSRIGIDFWEVVMEWEYSTNLEAPVDFIFKVNTREQFWEKLRVFKADMDFADVMSGWGDGDILNYL